MLPGATAAPPPIRAEAPERVALATESITLRDRSSLDLRFEGGLAVRIDSLSSGVVLAVERPLHVSAAPPVDPVALADAVRARGVPVARVELRGASPRSRGHRPGAR